MDERLSFLKFKGKKKGQVTIFIFLGLFIIVFGAVALMIVGIISGYFSNSLDQDTMIGAVNMSEAHHSTIGKFNEMIVNRADFWGICIIFGTIIGIFLSGYFLRGNFPKIAAGIDIVIIFTAFLVSLYLRSIYGTVVSSLDSAGIDFATSNLPKTNYFISNLPIFISIIGTITMVLTHMGIPRKEEEGDLHGNLVAA